MNNIPTTRGAPQLTDIAVESLLPFVGNLSRDDLQTTMGYVDSELSKLYEDRNVLLTGGGTIALTVTTPPTITFSAALSLEINSQVAGGTPTIITLTAGSTSYNFTSSGNMLYAIINRTGGTATIVSDSSTLPSVAGTVSGGISYQEIYLIAKRKDDPVSGKTRVYFRDGTIIEQNQSRRLGSESSLVDILDSTKQLIFSATGATDGYSITLIGTQTSNISLTLPNTTDTLVGRNTTDTLTNKTLTTPIIATIDSGTGTFTINTSGAITVPNATDTVALLAATQTLTNKTLTTPVIASITSSSGTFVINTSGTVTVPNATDTVALLAATQTFTNKTLTTPVIASITSSSGTFTINTSGAITVPNATDTVALLAATQTFTNKTLTSPSINTSLVFNGTSSGTLTVNSPSAFTSYAITLPTAQGGSNTVLTNNGSGVLTWAVASVPLAIGSAVTSSTAGSVLFINSSNQLAQDNSQFFWNDSTHSLGIGTASPSSALSVGSSNQFQVNSSGNLIAVNNVTYSWPSSQGASSTVLTNNGSGTLTWVAAASTLQQAYNNSVGTVPDIQVQANDNLDILLGTGTSAFTVQGNGGTPTVRVTDGYVQIDGYLSITGNTLQVNTTVTDADHWLIQPALATTPAIKVMPQVSNSLYTADLLDLYDGYNGNLAFQVNHSGNLVAIRNVTYSWPSSQGAASTFLQNNGSGTLTWVTGVTSVNSSSGAVTVNAINQLTGDVTTSAASGSQSEASTVAKIQGTTVSGTTGSGNVVFSTSPTITTPVIASITSSSGTFTINTSGAITVPNATDTVALLAATQTFTNKTLTSPSINTSLVFNGTSSGTLTINAPSTFTSYALTLPTAQGAASTFLQNNGSGTLTWVAAPVTSVNSATGAVTVNAINQLTGDITTSAASGSQSEASTVAKIQGTTVSGTTGSTNVVFSNTPTLTTPIQSSYEDFTEIATPAAPSSGILRVYSKAGDQIAYENSHSVETLVGTGTGQKNYLLASSSTVNGWTASSAAITVATTTTNVPRTFTTGQGILFTGVSGSTAYGYARFTLDPADYGVQLQLQFAMNALSGYVTNGFQVSVYSNTASNYSGTSTRLALSTDVSSITGLPNAEGTFQTVFTAPTSTAPYMEVRVGLNSTNTYSVVLSDILCGPGTIIQGTVATKLPTEQIFTSGSGTYTTPTGVTWLRVRMVGAGGGGGGSGTGATGSAGGTGGGTTFGSSFLSANGGFGGSGGATGQGGTGGTTSITAPAVGIAITGGSGTGTTYNNGAAAVYMAGGTGAPSPFGGAGGGSGNNNSGQAATGYGSGGGGAAGSTTGGGATTTVDTGAGGGAGGYIDVIIDSPSTTYSYSVGGSGSGGSGGTNGFGGGIGGTGVIIVEEHYDGGTGNGAVNLAQNSIQYLSNYNTSTSTSDTTSFAYGPRGQAIDAVSSAGAWVKKRVQLQSGSFSATGGIPQVRVSPDGNIWLNAIDVFPANQDSGNYYGIDIQIIASNDVAVDIAFGGNGANSTQAWSAFTSWYWRVDVGMPGQTVGFGVVQPGTSAGLVSASGVPGNTTGSAIAAGYVGEKLNGTVNTNSVSSGTVSSYGNITLTPGIWLVYGYTYWTQESGTAGTWVGGASSGISTNSTTLNNGHNAICILSQTTNNDIAINAPPYYAAVSTNTTLYGTAVITWTGGSPAVQYGGDGACQLYAIRIA